MNTPTQNEPPHVASAATHDARAIANELIHHGVKAERPCDPLQVIKLTYLCHGWMLGLYRRPMSTQSVLAWRYGPVIPAVYHEVKRYGRNPVRALLRSGDGGFDFQENDLIKQVFDVYGKFSGIDLSMLTHAEGSPWHQIWHREGMNATIPNDLIEKHFVGLSNE